MSTEDNKKVVLRFIKEVLVNGNMGLLHELCAPNYQNGITGQGIDSLKQFVEIMQIAIPDLHFSIENIVAEGDEVVVRYTMHGTNSGSVLGSIPTGRTLSIRSMTFYVLANGMIVEDDPIVHPELIHMLGIPVRSQTRASDRNFVRSSTGGVM